MSYNITIIGVGLIGGSLAKRLKQTNFANSIIGFGRNANNLQLAQDLHIIDSWTTDMQIAMQSDIIVLATPVGVFKEMLTRIKPFVTTQIITDVGSTKQSVERDVAAILGKDMHFVPAHPIAGKEKTGCESSDVTLFENKKVVITGGSESNKNVITQMWESVGAIVSQMDAKMHDEIFGLTSHLPHLLAFGFVEYMAQFPQSTQWTGGGFKDFSRIASSDSIMWADIFENNTTEILQHLQGYQQELKKLSILIENNNKKEYQQYFLDAKNHRDSWIES
jgi:prephenate dehydrogenase